MTTSNALTAVLLHGAWHGPWCWEFQVPELSALGYDVETVHLPSTQGVAGKTQWDDANAVRGVLEQLLAAGKRVVVLAHSYAGAIGGAAIIGLSEKERAAKNLPGGVVGLVHLCAYVFPGGMDQGAVIKGMGGLPYVTWDSPSEGLFTPKDPRNMFFRPDVSEERIEWSVRQLSPQSTAATTGIVPPQAWQDDSHFATRFGYILCTEDTAIPLGQQTAMIEGAGGKDTWVTRALEGSSHSPFLSRPRDVAIAFNEIVQVFETSSGAQ